MIDSNGVKLEVGDDVAYYGGWHNVRRGVVTSFTQQKVRIQPDGYDYVTAIFPFHVLRLGKGKLQTLKDMGPVNTLPAIPQ